METYIALLRGVNVGGKHKVPMAELRELLTALGYEDVCTLLQSGNAVFSSSSKPSAEALRQELAKRFGFEADVFLRTAAELDQVIAANPFRDEAKSNPSHLLVVFLEKAPDKGAVEAVQKAVVGSEVIKFGERELYITYPDGIGTSKLDRTPGWSKVAGAGTARNWNTVLKLSALAKQHT